jgi:glutamate-1-semialdehyde 2,1-aminomutase
MVRFARSGGEANAIATRIARAYTGKDKVAICGYHGWHDWYLAANLDADSNLDGHLLPGLQPRGVPRGLLGTTVPFAYNDIQELRQLLQTGEFAAVQMEVSRNFGPADGFLVNVRELCNEFDVVLIFDECTSGFRETFGGLHLKYGVNPDLAMFGKALGNGYAISSVIGVEEVMQAAQTSFISSTFWTERIGPMAALASIGEMERQRSWEKLPETGVAITQLWSRTFEHFGLQFSISGLDALPSFTLEYDHWPVLKTLLTQEMLDRGYLASSSFYASTMHSEPSIRTYESAFVESVDVVSSNLEENKALALLRGPVAQSGFRRLN